MEKKDRNLLYGILLFQTTCIICAISFFGLYYHNEQLENDKHLRNFDAKIAMLEKGCAVWNMSDSDFKLKQLEHNINNQDGVGASEDYKE